MILIAIGSNLPFPPHESPRDVCEAALARLGEEGVKVIQRSRWFESAPVPPSDQPWFVNGVAQVATSLDPEPLLERLQAVERAFGRERAAANAARTLDLDLLAYGERVGEWPSGLILPHPRMAERSFVLLPLLDIAPDWTHPTLRRTAQALVAELESLDGIRPIPPCGPGANPV
jgi:2-amino-4-hydroxy-6-hydroxymethyldihydropteridine diphosphokinase